MLRRTSLLLLPALAAALVGVLPAARAAADIPTSEVYARPADGIFHIDGHGWGHGRGLNQWGAQGAATQGVRATEILDKYYPGTGQSTIANTVIDVYISTDNNGDVTVDHRSGLVLRDEATGARYAMPSGYTAWRIYRDSTGLRVQGYNGSWRAWGAGGRSSWSGPMQWEGVSPLRMHFPNREKRDYRGVLRAQPSGSSVATVNRLLMEEYLYGVVPRESISSWHIEALKAQAIAARSYSAYKRNNAGTAPWDICETIQCQVYGGVRVIYPNGTVIELENTRTTAAVDQTRNVVRTFDGKPIFAEFSSSNGGHSTASTRFSYLAPNPDPWDSIVSPHHHWEAQVTAAQIERRYPSVGRLLRIKVTSRDGNGDWGGRVKGVVLEGVDSSGRATSVASSGAGIYNANTWPANANGLRGSWWKIRSTDEPDFSGSLVAVSTNAVVRPAHTTQVRFDVKNTGNLEWPVRGAVRSALRSDSPSYDEATWATPQRPSWLSANVSDPTATVVKPGQVARFEFLLAGNGRPEGDHTETFGVVWETKYWMALQVPLSYRIRLLFDGVVVATTGTPDPLEVPGWGTAKTWFDVKNTGDMAWPLTGPIHSTTIGSSPSVDSSWLNAGRPSRIAANVTRPGATEVAIGEVARFPVVLSGNGRRDAAKVTERFGIVWERRAHAASVRAPVTYSIKNVFTGDIVARPTTSLLVPSNGVATVTFDVKNTGNLTWPLRGAVKVSARYGSPSRAPSWPGSTRAGYLVANVTNPDATGVAPGETGRLSFELAGNGRAPGTTGTEVFGGALDGIGYLDGTISVSYEVRHSLAGSVVRVTSPLYLPVSSADAALSYVDVRNDGTIPWPVQGAVRLTASSSSPSRTPYWFHSARPATIAWNRSRPAEAEVRPGEIARFAVWLSGNGRPAGTVATDYFGMVYERVGYIPVRVPVRYTVRDVFTGSAAGVATDVTVPRAGTTRVWFDVRNTGNLTWPVGGTVNAAATVSDSRAPSWLNVVRPAHLTENRTRPDADGVRPGEVARFAFDLAGNNRPAGTYAEDFKVVWERRFWMPFVTTLRFTIA